MFGWTSFLVSWCCGKSGQYWGKNLIIEFSIFEIWVVAKIENRITCWAKRKKRVM